MLRSDMCCQRLKFNTPMELLLYVTFCYVFVLPTYELKYPNEAFTLCYVTCRAVSLSHLLVRLFLQLSTYQKCLRKYLTTCSGPCWSSSSPPWPCPAPDPTTSGTPTRYGPLRRTMTSRASSHGRLKLL
jgi:hypothetical protein